MGPTASTAPSASRDYGPERTTPILRPMCMPRGRLILVLTVLLATGGCSTQESASGGFGSSAGLLGCAELVAWGEVTGSEPVAEGLEVAFEVSEWVYPEAGGVTVTFLADDPAREVAAPSWGASEEAVLVIVSDVGPTQRLGAVDGARAVAQWREVGSARAPSEQCDNA